MSVDPDSQKTSHYVSLHAFWSSSLLHSLCCVGCNRASSAVSRAKLLLFVQPGLRSASQVNECENLSQCYRANAKVTTRLRMIVYRDVLNDAVIFTHLAKKRVVDVVVEVAECYFLGQHRSNVVSIVLKTYA